MMAPLIHLAYLAYADDILIKTKQNKTLRMLLNKFFHEGLKGSMTLLPGSFLDTGKIRFPKYNLILSFIYPKR